MSLRVALLIVMGLISGGPALAKDDGPLVPKRAHTTTVGFDQLLRELYVARATVTVGVHGKTLEGTIVGFAGGVLTLDRSHGKGEYSYIPVSSILFVNQQK